MLPTRTRQPQRSVWNDPWQVFRDVFENASNGTEPYGMYGNYPIDITEDKDNIHIEAELPGFKSDEVDITLEDGVLTIAAERKTEEKKDDAQRHLSERRFTKVHRRFSLPTSVDENNIDANLKEGVLHLTLHKKEEVKPRKIEVKPS